MYTYMCAQTTYKNIDIGTLGTCMGPYFVHVQVLGWVWFLGSRGTSLVIQWHRLPLRGHQWHFPCICSRWRLGSTLSWRRMVLLWQGAVRWYLLMYCIPRYCWYIVLHYTDDISYCLQCQFQSIGTRLNVLSKAMAWHNGQFSKRSCNTFSSTSVCGIYIAYINTYKPSTCRPSHAICPRSSTLMYGGRRSPVVACWVSDHWVASSNPLRGKFRH